MSGSDLRPEPTQSSHRDGDEGTLREPRAFVRVVRPGGGAARPPGAVRPTPPMPMVAPSALPPWLDPDGPAGAGPYAAGPHGSVGDGLAPEERDLRELMHRAVSDLRPAPGALDQLRRAVPQRRRQRRAIVGSAVATFALCAIGAMALHTSGMSVDAAGAPLSGQSTAGDTGGSGRSTGNGSVPTGTGRTAEPRSTTPAGSVGGGTATGGAGGTGALPQPGSSGAGLPQPAQSILRPTAGVSGGSPVTGRSGTSTLPSTPVTECTRSQLGAGLATVAPAPDQAGVTYGSFRVTNVSDRECKVSLTGAVAVTAVTGTDRSWIAVAQHTAGDPAGGLPLPTAVPGAVRLAPGQSYLVEFAWVPATGAGAPICVGSGTTGSTGSGSAAPAGSTGAMAGSTAAAGGSGDAGAPSASGDSSASSAQVGSPTVTLGHTPGAGGTVVANAVLPNACAGTVYRTDPIPAVR